MKKLIFSFIWLLLSVLLTAQEEAALSLPAEPKLVKAPNVSVGKWSAVACYPDDVEFLINFENSTVMITNQVSGDVSTYKAAIQADGGKSRFRADINTDTWLEIDSWTGISVVHQHCFTRVFTPRCP